MKILTPWLRSFLPPLDADDHELAEALTLRGIAVEGVFECNDIAGGSQGSVFDTDVTTNRVDAMNHYGIAREAAAIFGLPLHPPETGLPSAAPGTPHPVRIEAEDLCGRFTARIIRGVKIGHSQGKIAQWFQELGQKRILDAVDATNFVLLGMGHPTHAFDLDKVEGSIVVRRAHAGETLRLLDGTTRTLYADDLVVADEKKALGLAGVMGGWDSMITAETRNVLVESAWFDPAAIRRSSRRHGLHTDASHRFERGADFAAAPVANALVCRILLEACGGTLIGDLTDVTVPAWAARTVDRSPVRLRLAEVRRHLGTTAEPEALTAPLVESTLGSLGCSLSPAGEGAYEVRLPSWRLDLEREIDLIEEVARVFGYNRFADTLPTPGTVRAATVEVAGRLVRQKLLALGFSEALSGTFTGAAEGAFFAPGVPAVPVGNPLSEEAADLRPSLLPAMTSMLAANVHRGTGAARLFEAGAVFRAVVDGPTIASVAERESLALGIVGPGQPSRLASPADAPFYELKGAIEAVAALFATGPLEFAATDGGGIWEPGRGAEARFGSTAFAQWGQLSTAEAGHRKLKQPVFLATVELGALLNLPLRQPLAAELSRFQAVERDFSFTYPESVSWQEIESSVRAQAIPELRRVEPIEIFRDARNLPGRYSLLVRTVFQSAARTLVEEELTAWSAAIVEALEAKGGTQRS